MEKKYRDSIILLLGSKYSTMVKISVIMGIYNCSSTLVEALDSLLAQTYQDFKVVMCDDGSKDNTYEVAHNYVCKYPEKFVLLKNEQNLGLNATLNKCLSVVDTPLIARMDGDDISLPQRFETQVMFLEAHPDIDFVSTAMICFDDNGDFRTIRQASEEPTAKNFIRTTPFFHAPVLIKTSALKAVNGYTVDRRLLRVEDYHLWMKLYVAGYKGYNLMAPLYKMRDDRSAKSRRTWQNRWNEVYVKWVGYRMLHLPFYVYPMCLVPIIKYCIPPFIYEYLHRQPQN